MMVPPALFSVPHSSRHAKCGQGVCNFGVRALAFILRRWILLKGEASVEVANVAAVVGTYALALCDSGGVRLLLFDDQLRHAGVPPPGWQVNESPAQEVRMSTEEDGSVSVNSASANSHQAGAGRPLREMFGAAPKGRTTLRWQVCHQR